MDHQSGNLRLLNVDTATETMLANIGITSREEFTTLGAEKVYLLLLESGTPPSQEIRRRLIGAEQDIDWHIVAEREKRRVKSRFIDVDEP